MFLILACIIQLSIFVMIFGCAAKIKSDKRHVDIDTKTKHNAQKEVCAYRKPSTKETQKTSENKLSSEIGLVSEGIQTAKQPSIMKEPQIPTETTARESSSSKKEKKQLATTFVTDYDKDRAKTPNVPLPADWNDKMKKIIEGVDLRDPPTAQLPEQNGEVSIEKNLETLKSGIQSIQTQKELLAVEGTQEATAEHDQKLTVEEVAH